MRTEFAVIPGGGAWCVVGSTGGVPDHSDASRCYPTTRPPPRAHAQLMTRLPVCSPSLTNVRAHATHGRRPIPRLSGGRSASSWARLPLFIDMPKFTHIKRKTAPDGPGARPATQAAPGEGSSPDVRMTNWRACCGRHRAGSFNLRRGRREAASAMKIECDAYSVLQEQVSLERSVRHACLHACTRLCMRRGALDPPPYLF